MFNLVFVGLAYALAVVGVLLVIGCFLLGALVMFLAIRSWIVNRKTPKKIIPDWLASISQR